MLMQLYLSPLVVLFPLYSSGVVGTERENRTREIIVLSSWVYCIAL